MSASWRPSRASPGPRFRTAQLMRRNRVRRAHGRRLTSAAILAVAIDIALAWQFQQGWHDLLGWLLQNIFLTAGVIAFLSAVLVARHRTATRAEFAKSWLAALPVRRSVERLEALRIELRPAIMVLAAWTAWLLPAALILDVSSEGGSREAMSVWMWLVMATLLGALASYLFPEPKLMALPPGSRYVPKAALRRGRPLRPSLSALGHWPVRTMFARAQPKLVARSLVPVLLSMGLGSTADMAMVAIGLFAALGALALLTPAVIAVSRAALRWLSPLPVTSHRLSQVILSRSCAVMLAVSTAAGLLLPLLHVSGMGAISVAAVLAVASIAASVVGVMMARSVTRS